jgi:hypothetical protein
MRARSSNCIFLPQKRGGMENLADKVIPKVSRRRRFFCPTLIKLPGTPAFPHFCPSPFSLSVDCYTHRMHISREFNVCHSFFLPPLCITGSHSADFFPRWRHLYHSHHNIFFATLGLTAGAIAPSSTLLVCELVSEREERSLCVSPNFWTPLHKQKAFYCLPLQ